MKRTNPPAAWPTALFTVLLPAFASCQESFDQVTGAETTPAITAAPTVDDPDATGEAPRELPPDGDGEEVPRASAELAPDDAPQAGDSADVEAAGDSESANRGAASPDATPTDAAPSTSEEAESQPDAEPDASAEYPLQDNPLAGCSLCHVDIEDEFVGSLHFEEKVGCITCHGPSEGHLADENNEVKPDEVFARPDVNRLCERCHECSRPKPKKPDLTADGQRKVCTDCHGAHDVVLAADAGTPASP